VGRAIAGRLAREGATVAICGRSTRGVDLAVQAIEASGGRIAGIAADVSRVDGVQQVFAFVDRELGGLDVLVNNAGIAVLGSTADLSPEEWQQTLATNLSAGFYCSREAIARFRKRGGGFIVNIGSLLGKTAVAGGAAYCASKFGLNGLSEATMFDCRRENIGVCTILPGSIDTELFGPAGGAEWKIHPNDIAEMVVSVLQMPRRTLVSRVEMRPLKPIK
jgi:NAD(P)-dependent dehydrogenase (short-subunit alcohol dehydrogenase family)